MRLEFDKEETEGGAGNGSTSDSLVDTAASGLSYVGDKLVRLIFGTAADVLLSIPEATFQAIDGRPGAALMTLAVAGLSTPVELTVEVAADGTGVALEYAGQKIFQGTAEQVARFAEFMQTPEAKEAMRYGATQLKNEFKRWLAGTEEGTEGGVTYEQLGASPHEIERLNELDAMQNPYWAKQTKAERLQSIRDAFVRQHGGRDSKTVVDYLYDIAANTKKAWWDHAIMNVTGAEGKDRFKPAGAWTIAAIDGLTLGALMAVAKRIDMDWYENLKQEIENDPTVNESYNAGEWAGVIGIPRIGGRFIFYKHRWGATAKIRREGKKIREDMQASIKKLQEERVIGHEQAEAMRRGVGSAAQEGGQGLRDLERAFKVISDNVDNVEGKINQIDGLMRQLSNIEKNVLLGIVEKRKKAEAVLTNARTVEEFKGLKNPYDTKVDTPFGPKSGKLDYRDPGVTGLGLGKSMLGDIFNKFLIEMSIDSIGVLSELVVSELPIIAATFWTYKGQGLSNIEAVQATATYIAWTIGVDVAAAFVEEIPYVGRALGPMWKLWQSVILLEGAKDDAVERGNEALIASVEEAGQVENKYDGGLIARARQRAMDTRNALVAM